MYASIAIELRIVDKRRNIFFFELLSEVFSLWVGERENLGRKLFDCILISVLVEFNIGHTQKIAFSRVAIFRIPNE